MLELLYNVNAELGLLIFLGISISFSVSIYMVANFFVKNILNKKNEVVGRMLFRVTASLLALILSITFANQRINYFKIKQSIEAEAAQLVDIHVDLDLYGGSEANEIQIKIRDYVVNVSEDGWVSLQEDPFQSSQFTQFLEIYEDINRLVPETYLQNRLMNNLAKDIDEVSDFLQARIYSTRSDSNYLIYTSIFGVAAVMILFSIYPPDKLNVSFLVVYVGFISIVLYFILMMSNPLRGPLKIEAGPFIMLKESIEASSQFD
jgi:hypothetical protein